MIFVENLLKELKKNKIDYFSGVPDSVLKNFTNHLEKNKKFKNLTLTNEGSAVAAGIGYYLATQKVPGVYMQNSGLGNSINPLISIAHNKVYQIPMLLIIGWRGAPNLKDEPQHLAKGKITKQILKLCGIKFCILNSKNDLLKLKKLVNYSRKNKRIVACLIKNNILQTIKKFKKIEPKLRNKDITRAFFIENFLKCINEKTKIISSTGYLSRELYSKIRKLKLKISPFYMVGGMGHTSIVSLGYALESKKQIVCLDGDGSFLMHMGSAVSIAKYSRKNFKYILLNNKSHESVGGQSTNIDKMKLKLFAESVGYKKYFYLYEKNKSLKTIKAFLKCDGPSFLEVNIKMNKSENELPRPKDLLKVKKNFLKK
tara:strand:+ start:23425 stop:24537 length:1113 start_codon:yes stop_codon:yes gene_type:complete